LGRDWLPPQDSNLPSPVNSRQPSPRWLDGNISRIFVAEFGGARRNRTDDILLAEQALSLLSYGPEMVHKDGIEPPTRAPSTRRSTSELLVRNGLCEMERPVGNRTHRPHVGNVVLYH
jgi:hypothetical protein